ncbi:phage portal protein [Fusobacterium sp. IOR10]|uniref:phage portal protein n=1 Tax=Fusobacterium sp. IOR10 TaxID=2665157 RepID=UPI0013CFC14A|nr:phage portal protein [Fusobacterium sp. IOR10]
MKRIKNYFKGFLRKRDSTVDFNDWKDIFSFEHGYDTFSTDIKESTYFSCIKIISESIAKCNLQLKKKTDKGEFVEKDHYLFDLLRLRPNPCMSAIDCYKAFISLSRHYGIAGLYINRKSDGKIEGLYPVKIESVVIDDKRMFDYSVINKVLYTVSVPGTTSYMDCLDNELIILKDFTFNGIEAKANKTVTKESLDSSIKSQNYLNKLFSNGLTNKIVVQLTSQIKEESELKKIQDKFNRMFSATERVFTMPAGYEVKPLNLSLADAQFVELRKLTKEEIAMSFHVPLSKLGWVKENAKSEEQDNLQFLGDCLQVIFQGIEQEMDWKLLTQKERRKGYKIRFNINTMLRTDAKTQAEIINSFVKNGVYDLDTARRILGLKLIGGDPIVTLPSGQILLKDLLEGKVSYQNKGDK